MTSDKITIHNVMVIVMSTGSVILFSTYFIIVFIIIVFIVLLLLYFWSIFTYWSVFLHERSIIIIISRYYIIFQTLLLFSYHITFDKNRLITSIESRISIRRTSALNEKLPGVSWRPPPSQGVVAVTYRPPVTRQSPEWRAVTTTREHALLVSHGGRTRAAQRGLIFRELILITVNVWWCASRHLWNIPGARWRRCQRRSLPFTRSVLLVFSLWICGC